MVAVLCLLAKNINHHDTQHNFVVTKFRIAQQLLELENISALLGSLE
jgi:hypothetical protein